jgi:hypothetical protein
MAVDGNFDVEVKTPVGLQSGSLTLAAQGDQLTGQLVTPKGTSEITEGAVTGDHVSFTAKIKTPMGRMRAHIEGDVDGDRFVGTAKLPLGIAEISGVRR